MSTFKFSEKSKLFFTSDSHFGHNNIIRYCNRPFASVKEHDEALIENWNKVVSPDATVFHLGDFAFAGSDYTTEILSRLNGHIILIKGNHDNFQSSVLDKFEEVYPQLHIEIGKKSIYLNHYPFATYAGMYRKNATIQLFGHIHSGPASLSGKDTSRLDNLNPHQLDVGMDNFNYTPVSWQQVLEAINWQIEHKRIYAKRNLTKWEIFKLKLKYIL